jgi:hypothetical protein
MIMLFNVAAYQYLKPFVRFPVTVEIAGQGWKGCSAGIVQ